MKIVFFGTPDYVLPVLEALYKNFRGKGNESPIVAVVTQKPMPIGRKQELEYSPVDSWAFKKKIPIFFETEDLIKAGIKGDVGILESYGNILRENVLEYFPHGIVNIHPSLLPRWRGASPVPATLIAGDKETGGTAILLDRKVDHGEVISKFKEEISEDDTTETLRRRIFAKAADFLVNLIPPYLDGKIKLKKQDDELATFTTRVKKEDAFIPPQYLNAALQGESFKGKWQIPFMNVESKIYNLKPAPNNLHNFIRAMQPWPIAWTEIKVMVNGQWLKRRLKILKAHLDPSLITHLPLQIGNSQLILDEVQLEGKNAVSWKQFNEGYKAAILE